MKSSEGCKKCLEIKTTITCGKLGCKEQKCVDCIVEHYTKCGNKKTNGFLENYIKSNKLKKNL